MSEFLTEWFKGFEEGVEVLNTKDKETVFYNCARRCVNTGVLKLYEKLYLESGNQLDVFFSRLNELEDISGYVIKTGEIYEISFPKCYCDLHNLGYINTNSICECSRQSILYVMNTLNSEFDYKVDTITTVLGGDKECRFRITII